MSHPHHFLNGLRTWILTAALVAAGVAFGSLAIAQGQQPPDSGADLRQTTSCGTKISETVITDNAGNQSNATAFVRLPGAATTINVPAGGGCLKVLLTAESACTGFYGDDVCDVRAVLDPEAPNRPAFELHPQGGSNQGRHIDSEQQYAGRGHALQWTARVDPGLYQLVMQTRVHNDATTFFTDDWTLDVELDR